MANLTMEQFARKLERWGANQKKQLSISLRKAAEIVRAEAVTKHLSGPKMAHGVGSQTNATLQPRSGDLRTKTHTKVSVSSRILAQVINNSKYARIHSQGGTIVPKRASALKFKIGNQWYTKKSVTIPARPFLEPSLESKREDITTLIGKELVEAYRNA